MTKLSFWCRQLAVFVLLNNAAIAFAQTSASARSAIVNSGAMTYPGMPTTTPKMFVNRMTVNATTRPDQYFAEFYNNPDLSIGIQYNFDFDFDFNVESEGGYRAVPDGYYMLNVATFVKAAKNFTDPRISPNETIEDRFVTINNPTIVRVVNGKKSLSVGLKFNNPTQASVTNVLYVEFKPLTCANVDPCLVLDQDGEVDPKRSRLVEVKNAYNPYLFSTTWVPSQRSAAGKTDPNEKRAAETIRLNEGLRVFAQKVQDQRDREAARVKKDTMTPAEYAAANHLALISFNDPRLYAAGQRYMHEDIRQVIFRLLVNSSAKPISLPDDRRAMLTAFCEVITQLNVPSVTPPDQVAWRQRRLNAMIVGCAQDLDFLHMHRNFHVGHVDSNVPATSSDIRSSNKVLMNNYASTRSHDETASSVWTWKVLSTLLLPVKAATGMIGVVGKSVAGNLPFDYAHTVSTSNSHGKNEAAITSDQEYMDAVPLILTMTAHNVTSCFEVKMVPVGTHMLYNPEPNATNGFYVCRNVGESVRISEAYMHAVTTMKSTALTTAYDRQTQALNWVGRGDGDIADFYGKIRTLLDPNNKEQLGGVNWASWYTDTAARYLANRPPRATNVVSTTVAIGREKALPSFAGKIFGWYQEKF